MKKKIVINYRADASSYYFTLFHVRWFWYYVVPQIAYCETELYLRALSHATCLNMVN